MRTQNPARLISTEGCWADKTRQTGFSLQPYMVLQAWQFLIPHSLSPILGSAFSQHGASGMAIPDTMCSSVPCWVQPSASMVLQAWQFPHNAFSPIQGSAFSQHGASGLAIPHTMHSVPYWVQLSASMVLQARQFPTPCTQSHTGFSLQPAWCFRLGNSPHHAFSPIQGSAFSQNGA